LSTSDVQKERAVSKNRHFKVDRQVDARGFRERLRCVETWRDDLLVVGRVLSAFAYHPCNVEGGRNIPPPREEVAFCHSEIEWEA
jgi:hypothetical protein